MYISYVIQRYGHPQKICKSQQRCPACAKDHDLSSCPTRDKPVCVFCKKEHYSTEKGTTLAERSCSEFLKQKEIKQIMAIHNLSYYEASKATQGKINPPRSFRFGDLNEFPQLRNHDSTYDNIPNQLQNFSGVTSNPAIKKSFKFTRNVSFMQFSSKPKRRNEVPSELLFYHNGRLPDSYSKRPCNSDNNMFNSSESMAMDVSQEQHTSTGKFPTYQSVQSSPMSNSSDNSQNCLSHVTFLSDELSQTKNIH